MYKSHMNSKAEKDNGSEEAEERLSGRRKISSQKPLDILWLWYPGYRMLAVHSILR